MPQGTLLLTASLAADLAPRLFKLEDRLTASFPYQKRDAISPNIPYGLIDHGSKA